jgi:TatD DNase family protein
VFDSHCHLDFPEFDADRPALLASARELGIVGWLVPGVREDLWPAQEALASERGVQLAVGLHPWWLSEVGSIDRVLSALDARITRIGAVAVGECGLDAKRSSAPLAGQIPLFEGQLALARDRQLPVILHQVGARDAFLRAIERVGGLPRGGVVHAFSGDAAWAQALLLRGFHLGFGASVASPKRDRLRQALREVPAERLLLETDAPAGPSARVPADLANVCRQVAELRGTAAEPLAAQCDANLSSLLGQR